MRVTTMLTAVLLAAAGLGAPSAAAGPTLLFDAQSGKVLYAEDADDLWHPASLTKIMTAYLTFEAIKTGKLTLESRIPNSELASIQPPSKIGLPVGGELTVELALKALIVKSANDVAVMLAEAVSGSEPQFIQKMNEAARRLGMTRTRFVNANGLPAAEQVSTARDLGRLSRAVLKDYPQYAHYWALPDMHIGAVQLTSHNGLLKTFEGADGLKTGFICDSGFNVVATATREGRKLMAVVLGEPSAAERTVRSGALLQHGFQTLGWKAMFASATIDSMPVAPGAKGIATMRDTGIKWECGARRQVAKAKPKTKAKKAGAATTAAAAAAAAPASTAAKQAVPRQGAKAAAAAPAAPASKAQ